ncbi:25259_t:CDS:2, partial [Gigaspora rosea]
QNKGNLLSPFLQDKALSIINSSFYKAGQDSNSLIQIKQLTGTLSQCKYKQRQHISRVRAAARKPLIVNSQNLKATIQATLMKNKFNRTIQVTNSILGFLIEESLPLSISRRSIIRWNKEISEIHVNKIFNQDIFSEYFTFGIMLGESTRGFGSLYGQINCSNLTGYF